MFRFTIHNKAQQIMKYQLNQNKNEERKISILIALKKLKPYIKGEERDLIIACIATLFTSAASLVAPLMIGYTIDNFIQKGNFHEVLVFSGYLLLIYLV